MEENYSSYKKLKNTDAYVLNLAGDLRKTDNLNVLEKLVTELKKKKDISNLIIHQRNSSLKIHSKGMSKIILLYSALHDKKIVFSHTSGSFQNLLNMNLKELPKYNTIREAIKTIN